MSTEKQFREPWGLSGAALKWTALLLMVLDHIHYIFGFTGRIPEWFSMLGRLSAPLFLFCLAEGFAHTHNRKKYFAKVYAIHLLMSGLLFLTICSVIPVRPDGFYPRSARMWSFRGSTGCGKSAGGRVWRR